MEKLNWLKELVKAEQKLEESGIVDLAPSVGSKESLETETIEFLNDLKIAFIEATNLFNDLKSSPLGRVKIYGIAKTQSDFMLFRSGYKLIFTMTQPGQITVRFSFISPSFVPQNEIEAAKAPSHQAIDDVLEAKWGVFGDIEWTFKGQPIKMESLIKYYLTRFLQESSK